MKFFAQASEHALETYLLLQEQYLAGHCLVEPQLSLLQVNTTHIPTTSGYSSRAWFKSLLGSGAYGAFHHDNWTSMWRTFSHTHNTTVRWKICCYSIQDETNQLGTSRLTAERRLHEIERRLERDPELKFQYHNFKREYEDLGHMEPVNSRQGRETCYFLPRHQVFKETSSTIKTWAVFDGGTKSSNGLSLSDILQVGPTVQQGLYFIVLRFITHQVCFTADIAKRYRQIVAHPKDRPTKILWRYSFEEPFQEHKLTSRLWDFFSSFPGNKLSEEVGRRQPGWISKGRWSTEQRVLCWSFKWNIKLRGSNWGAVRNIISASNSRIHTEIVGM